MPSKKPTVWVLGDSMVDLHRHVIYQRPSPEDPKCPVAIDETTTFDLGGAANAARWIAGLGEVGDVTLHCHYPYQWEYAGHFLDCLNAASVRLGSHLGRDHGRGTLKERIYLHHPNQAIQQVIRIDHDTDIALDITESDLLCMKLAADMECLPCGAPPSAIVIADYGKGMFTGYPGMHLMAELGSFCRNQQIPVFVNAKDPSRWRNFEADFLICNEQESRALGPTAPPPVACRHLVVTRAEHGVRAFVLGGASWATFQVTAPAPCKRAVDVTGAGDAFLAGLSSHLAADGFRRGTVLNEERLARAIAAAQAAAESCVLQLGCGEPGQR